MPKGSVAERHDTFKIGGHMYKIERNLTLISRQGMWGQCNHIDRVLKVDSTIPTRDYLCVLMHEFLEAVKENRDMDMSHHMLSNLEDSFFAMLIDNNDLIVDALTNIKD